MVLDDDRRGRMFGRRKRVRNDPELCRQIEEVIGGPEGARAGLEAMLGKDLTRELLGEMDRGYRNQRAKRGRR
jgi:hypothetical protein